VGIIAPTAKNSRHIAVMDKLGTITKINKDGTKL
jgi:hypothetical protein